MATGSRRLLALSFATVNSSWTVLAAAHQRLDVSRRQAGVGGMANDFPAPAQTPQPAGSGGSSRAWTPQAACATPCDRPAPPVPDREAMWPDLTEPLTAREQEVLDLLAGRFSNKEIATTLNVSWQTVAKHTNNIYQKLRVTGRRDAVDRAEALGIFPLGRDHG
jgi:DNA-binding CsgD family transcriptional regulator